MKQPTSNSPQHMSNWDRAFMPVFRGEPLKGTRSLRVLADALELDQLVPMIASQTSSSDRMAAIGVIHEAVVLLSETLLPSAALDGVTIDGTPDQFGLVFEDNGALSGFWIAEDIRIRQGVQVVQLGNQFMAMLRPIVAAVQTRENLSRRGLELVLFDAVQRACRRLDNGHIVKMEPGWVDELLTAMGDSRRKPPRTVTVQADEGEPVELAIPRVCCVLAKYSMPHACPTCPQQQDATRCSATEAWLRSMDDQEFLAETGRMRHRRR